MVDRLAVELDRGRPGPRRREQIRERMADRRYSRYAPVPDRRTRSPTSSRSSSRSGPTCSRRWWPSGPPSASTPTAGWPPTSSATSARSTPTSWPTSRPATPTSRTSSTTRSGRRASSARTRKYLRGTPGLKRIEVDTNGDPVRVIDERQPVQGDDLVLSIDIDLQALAQQKVERGPGRRPRAGPTREGNEPNNGITGAAVVEDPRNGQVLAMASYPTFDPAEFADGVRRRRVGLPQRPGQPLSAQQLRHPGPVGAGVDLQAVRRRTPRLAPACGRPARRSTTRAATRSPAAPARSAPGATRAAPPTATST